MLVANSLYLTTPRTRVGARGQSLEARADGSLVGRFPLAGLEHVFAFGHVEFTTDALAKSVSAGVRVASLTRSGRLRFTVGGPTKGNVLLRIAQHEAASDPGYSLALASRFVAGKLQNQRRLIRRWSWDATGSHRRFLDAQREVVETRLGNLGAVRSGDHLRGLEGDATRRYFKALGAHLHAVGAEFAFVRRTRRPPADPVNCVLSFVYAMLTSEMIGALEAVGLDPQIGFLHQARPGRPSLALDLLEEFRTPLADRLVVSLFSRRALRAEHFNTLAKDAWYLTDEGRRVVITAFNAARNEQVPHLVLQRDVPKALLPAAQATLLARRLRGDLHDYPPFVMAQ